MNIYNSNSFKVMPWKNGGGTTTEIYRHSRGEEIILRLSSANVSQNGPFSIFPNIDRILFLISGKGFRLDFDDHEVLLDRPHYPIEFQGEENINCTLIDGPCVDFNIMTNRHFAKSNLSIQTISHLHKLICSSDKLLIYLIEQKILVELNRDKEYIHQFPTTEAYFIATDFL